MAILYESPTSGEEFDLGEIEISAQITSDPSATNTDTFFIQSAYPVEAGINPNVKLTLTIANNNSYTDATVYESNYVSSGSTVTFTHTLQSIDTYYIKMETVDSEGGTNDLLEYTITAEQILYFINEPSINTTGPKANKITVRSDTASATATTATTPSADEIVHKIVDIDEGDSTVCQEVADQLIQKWGSEQVTVSGDVDLVVNIEFKKRVKIIADNLDINEYMMVQKKEHKITDGITTVTCGDIQLSESELLARILDDLGV